MCDAHLVPDVDELRPAVLAFACGECQEPVAVGERYRHVEGALDDGTPGRFLYRAHESCYQLSMLDHEDNDGCFTYGGVQEVGSVER